MYVYIVLIWSAQLCDLWVRIDLASQEGLDPIEFQKAFHGHFTPWRQPVDAGIAGVTLNKLFMKIDANGDGRVSWEEFSEFVMSEAMQSYRIEKVEISVFAKPLYDNIFNDLTAYHKDMITHIVNVESINKYVTTARDGTLRVWSSKDHQHIHTIKLSEKSATTWATSATEATGLKSSTHPFGVLLVVSSDRYMRFFDLKGFTLLSSVALDSDTSPICCSGFVRKAVRRLKNSDCENLIIIGDTEGKIIVYEQTEAFLGKRERNQASTVRVGDDKGPAPIMTIKAHTDHVTQVQYIQVEFLESQLEKIKVLGRLVRKDTKEFLGKSALTFDNLL